MAFNPRFHQGANKYSIADAMNPFQYLKPAFSDSKNLIPINSNKDAVHCEISISREVIEADIGNKHRLQHQDESDSKSQVYEWPIPSQSRECYDSV